MDVYLSYIEIHITSEYLFMFYGSVLQNISDFGKTDVPYNEKCL